MNDANYLLFRFKLILVNIGCYLNMNFENEVFGLTRVYCIGIYQSFTIFHASLFMLLNTYKGQILVGFLNLSNFYVHNISTHFKRSNRVKHSSNNEPIVLYL